MKNLFIILIGFCFMSCYATQTVGGVHQQTKCEVSFDNSQDAEFHVQIFELYGKQPVIDTTVAPNTKMVLGNVDHSGFGNAYKAHVNGEFLERFDTKPGIGWLIWN